MLFGPPLERYCPHCGTLHEIPTLASGNGFSSLLWSDGFLHSPHWRDSPRLLQCAVCARAMWVDDMPEAEGTQEQDADWTAIRTGPEPAHASFPEVRELARFIDEGVYRTAGEERYLRQRLWWALNHPARNQGRWWQRPEPVFTGAEREALFAANAKALDRLLADEEAGRDALLMRAELLREQGRFADCLGLLDQVTAPDRAHVVDTLRRACAAQQREVVPIPDPPPPPIIERPRQAPWWRRLWPR